MIFRMSMQIGKAELVALAREHHEGPQEFDEVLRRCNKEFVTEVRDLLWNDLEEKYPERDFNGSKRSLTRANLAQRIKATLKCKFLLNQ